jgi:hypothetical protein
LDRSDRQKSRRPAKRSAEAIEAEADAIFSNGGLDADWFVRHGPPTLAGRRFATTWKEKR